MAANHKSVTVHKIIAEKLRVEADKRHISSGTMIGELLKLLNLMNKPPTPLAYNPIVDAPASAPVVVEPEVTQTPEPEVALVVVEPEITHTPEPEVALVVVEPEITHTPEPEVAPVVVEPEITHTPEPEQVLAPIIPEPALLIVGTEVKTPKVRKPRKAAVGLELNPKDYACVHKASISPKYFKQLCESLESVKSTGYDVTHFANKVDRLKRTLMTQGFKGSAIKYLKNLNVTMRNDWGLPDATTDLPQAITEELVELALDVVDAILDRVKNG